jgi:hypothetical protein
MMGPKKAVEKTKNDLMERFDCKHWGDIKEYVGCKIERTKKIVEAHPTSTDAELP